MTPAHRSPQQRDRRFARVRNLTVSIFLASGLASIVFIGYAHSIAKPVSTTVPTTVPPTTTTTASQSGSSTTYSPPTTVPVTTTTVCTTTPSGTTTCY